MKRMLKACLLLLSSSCSLPSMAQAVHALTLYDEPPAYAADFKHFDFVNPNAPKGGTLHLSDFRTFDSLNPFIARGNPSPHVQYIFDTLGYQSPDEPYTVYGLIAEKMEKAPDNSFVRFYINPKAHFNDGSPVTAKDVAFSFNVLIEKGHPLFRSYYADVAQAVIEDEHTIRFDFKTTTNYELPLILTQIAVLPEHWWQDRDFSRGSLEPPLTSGPYKVLRAEAGRRLVLKRVDDWWAKDLPVTQGMYNFDRIQIDIYRDSNVELEAFKAGQVDFRMEYSAKDWATGYEGSALKRGDILKEQLVNHTPSGMQGYIFNLRDPRFKDPKVRQALGYLFDFEWTNKQLFYSSYKRTDSYFVNSELAATQLPSEAELAILEPLREQIPAQVFTDIYAPPQTDGSGIIRQQRLAAWKLLQEAGYRIENDKMVNAEGVPLVIEFITFQDSLERVLLPFKRNLAELGIELKLRKVDVSQYLNRMRNRDFEMSSTIWPQTNSPGNEQRDFWHSSTADSPASRNYLGIKDPAIDTLVEGLINAHSRDELITYTHALDRVLLWNHFVIPNYYSDIWRIAHWKRIRHPEKIAQYDYALMTWWIDDSTTQPQEAQQ